jgi:hypothetical protein
MTEANYKMSFFVTPVYSIRFIQLYINDILDTSSNNIKKDKIVSILSKFFTSVDQKVDIYDFCLKNYLKNITYPYLITTPSLTIKITNIIKKLNKLTNDAYLLDLTVMDQTKESVQVSIVMDVKQRTICNFKSTSLNINQPFPIMSMAAILSRLFLF